MLRRVLPALLWLAVVIGCATGVWAVIRSAGEDVATTLAIPTSTSGTSVHGEVRSSTRPTPRPAAPRPSTPSATPSEATPAQATTSEATTSEARRRWQGPPGDVVTGCRDATIAFRGAQANAGWRVEVEDRGPARVEVVFSQGDDDDPGATARVEAACASGAPRYDVRQD